MRKKLVYTEKDFTVLSGEETGDLNISYVFNSNDGKIVANFFFTPGNVQIRGLIWNKGNIEHTFLIEYPLANPLHNPMELPDPQKILRTVINKLKRGEYK